MGTTVCASCHSSLLGELSSVHTTLVGDDNWKLMPPPPGLCPRCSSLCWFYSTFFIVISHNPGYNNFSASLSPPSTSLHLAVVLGIPQTAITFQKKISKGDRKFENQRFLLTLFHFGIKDLKSPFDDR